jgi:hypothetical protein
MAWQSISPQVFGKSFLRSAIHPIQWITLFSRKVPVGHFQGGNLQRNKFIINADRDMHEVKIQCYQLKWMEWQ